MHLHVDSRRNILILATAASSVLAAKCLSYLLRRYLFVPRLTILADLPDLGKPRKDGKLPGRAIICGGSVAGLFSAAVCADNYEEVVIIEPEAWLATEDGIAIPKKPDTRLTTEGFMTRINKRARVMQYTSTHVTQPISLVALRELFPNFDQEAAALGGRPTISDLHMHISGIPLENPKIANGRPIENIYFSRLGYETLLRRLVKKYRPNVQFMVGTVTELEFSRTPNIVTGVHVRTESEPHRLEPASLVVDATGFTQAGFYKWLKGRGLPPSLRIHYDPLVYYMTATFQIPPHLEATLPIPGGFHGPRWLLTGYPSTAVENKSIIMGIVENSQLILTCGGWNDLERPHDPLAIKAYLESLNWYTPIAPWVLDLMDVLEEHIDELDATYVDLKVPPCNYVRYHEAPLGSIPSNFVAVGDSMMKANPIYAQGMAKACIGAVTLDGLLRRETHASKPFPSDFSTKYFAAHAHRVERIWERGKAADYGVKTTIPVEGESVDDGAGERAFSRHTLAVSMKDPGISSTFWNIRMFLAPSTDLYTFSILWRVGWRWLFS